MGKSDNFIFKPTHRKVKEAWWNWGWNADIWSVRSSLYMMCLHSLALLSHLSSPLLNSSHPAPCTVPRTYQLSSQGHCPRWSPPGINTFLPDSHGSLLHFIPPSKFCCSHAFSQTSFPKGASPSPIPFTLLYHFLVWMTLNLPQGWCIYYIHSLPPCTRMWVPGENDYYLFCVDT